MQKVRDRLPEKRRKDAVLAIEYLITASPEAMQEWGQERGLLQRCTQVAAGAPRQGQRGLCRGAPGREHAPHVRLRGAPGRVHRAAERPPMAGGSKALSEMQTDFAATVGRSMAWSAVSRAAGPSMSG